MAELRQPRSRRPRLKKGLGQHHLRSPASCRASLDFLELEGADVLEIGGGGGVLTRQLIARARRVVCWEVDPEWAFTLRERLAGVTAAVDGAGLQVVVGDALEIDWRRLPVELRLAGNLPYNVGTRLILDFLLHSRVARAAFLVQREVADRLVAGPGDSAYGSLSVAAAALARVERLGRVSRRDFRPPPKVDGAFVGFERRTPPVAAEELDGFLRTVREAFAIRRKTLRNALARVDGRDAADAVLEALGWPATIRAEALGTEDFVRLHRAREAQAR